MSQIRQRGQMSREEEKDLQSPGPIPWLACINGDQTFYYDFVRRTYKESSVPWLRRTVCKDVHTPTGWLLLQNLDTLQLSMFNPPTHQRILLPIPDVEINTRSFTCRFASQPPHCHVVAIATCRFNFFLHCPPHRKKWSKQYSYASDPNIDHFNDAVLYQGKIWAVGDPQYVMSIDVNVASPDPVVRYLRFKMINPAPYLLKLCDSYLLTTDDEIFNVQVYNQDIVTYSPRTVVVLKLTNFSAWTMVESIGNKVFLLEQHYSISISTSVKNGNMIYFTSRQQRPFTFNMKTRCLLSHFDDKKWDDINVMPYWVVFDYKHQMKMKDGSMKVESINNPLSLTNSLQHPSRHLNNGLLGDQIRGLGVVNSSWSLKTPWLMMKSGNDFKFKLLDPCTHVVYEFDVPNLSNKEFSYSKDGWILASGAKSKSLVNPFTKETINLPFTSSSLDLVSMSSSPSHSDCLVFSIMPDYDEGDIHLLSLRDARVTSLKYINDIDTDHFTHCSPVYHNGLFYCLSIEGNIGIYDPVANSWNSIEISTQKDLEEAQLCFLLESEGQLMSVFLHEYEYPIGVFILDLPNRQWKEMKHLGDRTLFVGSQGCFIVTAPEWKMANKIYLPKFREADGYELVSYDVGVDYTFEKPFTCREYEHIWVKPKNVRVGLDQVTRKVCHRTILPWQI